MFTKLVFSKNICVAIFEYLSYWKDNHTLVITYVLCGVG